MLPSARPLMTSWPMRDLESAFLNRPGELRCLALVAVDAERVCEVTLRVRLVVDQHAFPALGGRQCVTYRLLAAADFFDDRFQHISVVVVRDSKVVCRYPVFFLHAFGPIQDFGVGR